MPQSLTTKQITAYIDRVNAGGLPQVLQVYDELYAQGYNYAGWAAGVARGDTITGQSALKFLKDSAVLGWNGSGGENLSPEQIDRIRVAMSLGYLNTLAAIARESNGIVSKDVIFRETEDFHAVAFEANNLSIDNWTLKIPMDLIRATRGEQAVEEAWEQLRDTGGTGLDSLMASTALANSVGRLAFSADPEISGKAQTWMALVPGLANFGQIGNFLEVMHSVMPTETLSADPFTGVQLPWSDAVFNDGTVDLQALAGGRLGAAQRLDEDWVAADLGGGARLRWVSPQDPGKIVVIVSGIYSQIDLPDGQGGYLTLGAGEGVSSMTQWAGAPETSTALESVRSEQVDGVLTIRAYHAGALQSTSVVSRDADQRIVQTTDYRDGHSRQLVFNADGMLYRQSLTTWNDSRSASDTVQKDGREQVISHTYRETLRDDEGGLLRIDTVTTAGGTVQNVYDGDNQLLQSLQVDNGAANLPYAAASATSFMNMIDALRSGTRISAVAGGVNTLVDLQNEADGGAGTVLTGASQVLSGAAALYNLQQAISHGDVLGSAQAGAQTLSVGVNAIPRR